MKYALAFLLLSTTAHAQTTYVQCGPGGCAPCRPQYYYQEQPQYQQRPQQRPSPDGIQTPQVGSPNTPQFQPLPPPPPVTTPAIPTKPAAPVEPPCTCGPKWTAINAQIASLQSDMQSQVTAVQNLTTIVQEIKEQKQKPATVNFLGADGKVIATTTVTPGGISNVTLPPINFRVLDQRGAGYSTEYQPAPLGSFVTLPFGPVAQ